MDYEKIGKVLIITGLIFLSLFTLIFLFNTTKLTISPIKADIWGQYGDIIGGFVGTIVALVGVLLLYETLRQQRNSFIKQQVETRFFELLRLHRENVNELKTKGKIGRAVFIRLRDEMINLMSEVKSKYPQNAHQDARNNSVPESQFKLLIKFQQFQLDFQSHCF